VGDKYSNNQLKEAYRNLNTKVVSGINANSVIDFLFEAGILSDADYHEVCNKPEGPQKTRSLMALLHNRGHPTAFVKLHEVVKKEEAYRWLAKEAEVLIRPETVVIPAAAKAEQKG
jgi:Caspase recruitment domain